MLTKCVLCHKIIWFWQKHDIFGKAHKECNEKQFFEFGKKYNIPNLETQWALRCKNLYYKEVRKMNKKGIGFFIANIVEVAFIAIIAVATFFGATAPKEAKIASDTTIEKDVTAEYTNTSVNYTHR